MTRRTVGEKESRTVGQAAMALTMMALAGGGCASKPEVADLGGIYKRAARMPDDQRNPVVVVPGILGSRLEQRPGDRVVWGAFAGDYAHPATPDGARLLAHPMGEGVPLAALTDDVVANGALDRLKVNVLGINILLNAYRNILGTLGVGGFRDQQLGLAGAIDYGTDHYTCFQFAYDWRRDVSESAAALGEAIRHAARTGSEARGGAPTKVDVVAHSMGGLVLRYFLRYGDQPLPEDGGLPELTWAGAELIEHAILVATPNAGSADSLLNLVEGVNFAPILPHYDAALLATMPAVYQLLPRPRHGVYREAVTGDPLGDEIYELEFWERMEWGLLDPSQDRVLRKLLPQAVDRETRLRIARDHVAKCLSRAKQLHEALDRPATPPAGLELHIFAGDAEATASVLGIARSTGRVRVIEHAPGDGTVTRASALLDNRVGREWTPRLDSPIDWDGVHFLFRDHLGLTQDPEFTDNVLYLLLEKPLRDR